MSDCEPTQCHPNTIMLTCADMQTSAHFYRDVLGFEMAEAWPDKENPLWANMVLDEQSVMIGAAMEPDQSQCSSDHEGSALMSEMLEEFRSGTPGAGASFYFRVADVDAYFQDVTSKGAKAVSQPKSQFYGLRDFQLRDPDGYRLQMYSPITMESCQSCGMPMAEAKPGQMYCGYCANEKGELHPYESVFEGTVTGYFMAMQGMDRGAAEVAAKEHLSKMPAWAGRPD
jgi:uncharacterized glyoxalase superfamily protein PhnB